jgi:hypothetical protein
MDDPTENMNPLSKNHATASPQGGARVGKLTDFTGTVLRIERDGFAIIRFDQPIGPSANNLGLISSSTGTTVMGGFFFHLKPGVHVKGTAEPVPNDVASIKTIAIDRVG